MLVYRQTAKLSNDDHLIHHNYRSKHQKYFSKTQMPNFPGSTTSGTARLDTMQSQRSRQTATGMEQYQMMQDGGEEPPSIYIRNYETSKDRCERMSSMNKANILSRTVYDPKRIVVNGNNLRPKLLSKEKHMPLKLAEVNEPSRIKEGIAERQGVSLRESFNMDMYNNPIWKSVDKQKWRSQRGVSYEG